MLSTKSLNPQMNVMFAPDWSRAVPYQRCLAAALTKQGVTIEYLRGYKRVFPLSRLLSAFPCDLLHLHWPEAYFPTKRDYFDWFRRARFIPDLSFASHLAPYVMTAHNLHEHNLQNKAFGRANYAAAYRRARLIFAHSEGAREGISTAYRVPLESIRIIPHGDLSVALPPPIPRAEARSRLGLPSGPLCLIFGAIEPYKGLEEIFAWWRAARNPVQLAIVGKPHTLEYEASVAQLTRGLRGVSIRFGWLSDEELSIWLSAVDCVIFNYRNVFTSGAACLARSWGLPILLPSRLSTVDLDEPDPRVFRFIDLETDFLCQLQKALAIPPDFASASRWRKSTAWERVAKLTAEGYREAFAATA